jgi:basic membrane protein A
VLANVTGLTYATQENSYMAGCLAALVAQKKGKKTIGVVGGIKIPPVDAFLAGYKAGAAKCVKGTKVLIGYSNSFTA